MTLPRRRPSAEPHKGKAMGGEGRTAKTGQGLASNVRKESSVGPWYTQEKGRGGIVKGVRESVTHVEKSQGGILTASSGGGGANEALRMKGLMSLGSETLGGSFGKVWDAHERAKKKSHWPFLPITVAGDWETFVVSDITYHPTKNVH